MNDLQHLSISVGPSARDLSILDSRAACQSTTERGVIERGREPRPVSMCATSLKQVEAAWELVYQRYTQMELIAPNRFDIHTSPRAVGAHACVVWGPMSSNPAQKTTDAVEVGYTMTLFQDNPQGLALDSVYSAPLEDMRSRGRRLLEVGMLADRRDDPIQGVGAMFSMMRLAISYSLYTHTTDVLIGVHPRHAPFYKRRYGFEEFAAATTYPMVQNKPVVGLRLALMETLKRDVLPKGLLDGQVHPVSGEAFANRFLFLPEDLRHSRIANFLRYQHSLEGKEPMDPSKNRAHWVAPAKVPHKKARGESSDLWPQEEKHAIEAPAHPGRSRK